MGPRRKAREYALQMLFQWDITHDSIEQIAATFFQNQPKRASGDRGLLPATFVTGTVEHVEEIDRLIQRARRALAAGSNGYRRSQHSSAWPLRNSCTVRNAENRRHQRGHRDRAAIQHAGIAAIHQRHSGQHQEGIGKRNGTTRTDSHSKAEADPGAWIRPISDFLPEHAHPGRCQRSSLPRRPPKISSTTRSKYVLPDAF